MHSPWGAFPADLCTGAAGRADTEFQASGNRKDSAADVTGNQEGAISRACPYDYIVKNDMAVLWQMKMDKEKRKQVWI